MNHDADLAEFLIAQSRRELKAHPRSPIITSPKVAKEIDLSNIMRMSPEEIDRALKAFGEAA